MSLLKKLLRGSRTRIREDRSQKEVGAKGEGVAATFLQRQGMDVLERNYRHGHGEIDIVARDGTTLVFVEVKTATTDQFGPPEGWVDPRKQRQVAKIAEAYLQRHRISDVDCRFDVVAVDARQDDRITHIQNAFWINE